MTRWARDVTPDKAHSEYPRPQMVRTDWLNLNGLWQLAMARKDEEPPFGKSLPQQILVPFPPESALSGVMKPVERVWYRRTFEVKQDWAGRRVLLHFGAVNWETTVWVNGKKLDTHRGGYDSFSVDITGALRPNGVQELVLEVWNPIDSGPQPRGKQVRKPGGIMYTASTGIWQTAWLEPVAPASIGRLSITPDVDRSMVRLTVHGRGTTDQHRVTVTVREGAKAVSAATGEVGKPVEVALPELRLWCPETPFLYDLDIELHEGDRVVDRVKSYFGMRKVALGLDNRGIIRILLNGKPYFQIGFLDQGFWPDGIYTAPTDEALRYDIEITRKLGMNLARKHVKVEPDRWYYWCDKLGLLVWQDMPSGNNAVGSKKPGEHEAAAKQFELELQQLIDGRSNHPCIIMWIPFNEGWGQYDTQRIVAAIKKQDPSRLVNNASGWTDMKCGDVHDIHAYPGPASPKPEPARAAVLGEFGGLGLGIEGHTWGKTWGYAATVDRLDLTRRYERLLQRAYQLKDDPGLCAAVYTQTTDVEVEGNGLLTYDREVIKVDLERVAAANRGNFAKVPQVRVVVPTSQREGLSWRYTLEKPGREWFKSDFDDSSWKQGPGGFGTHGTPGAVVRTEWKTADIWLRRAFTLPEGKQTDLLLMHHDEDVEVYINGVLAAKAAGFVRGYEEFSISPTAKAALKPGKNLIAIHCRQTKGGQYIDAGLAEQVEPPK
jgi:hypothetical protein